MNSYDFYREGIYSDFKVIKRTVFSLNKHIIETYIDLKSAKNTPIAATGKPVTGGAVQGRIITDQNNINRFDGPLIFLTARNVPPDVIMQEGKFVGYISKEGGITSHAALVAIGEHKPCVTDVSWQLGDTTDAILIGSTQLQEGDTVTLDANTGSIYASAVPIISTNVTETTVKTIRDAIIQVLDNVVSDNLMNANMNIQRRFSDAPLSAGNDS